MCVSLGYGLVEVTARSIVDSLDGGIYFTRPTASHRLIGTLDAAVGAGAVRSDGGAVEPRRL